MSAVPKVFLSYSHDSQEHCDAVLKLANSLRALGIEAIVDQYFESPDEGWPRWMEKWLRISDYVLVVCTEGYHRKVIGEEKNGRGLGVRWESHLLYQHIYNTGTLNARFIPVLLSREMTAFIPFVLQSATHYCIARCDLTDDAFGKLYLRITKRSRIPPLGEILPLDPVDRNARAFARTVRMFSDLSSLEIDSAVHEHIVAIANIDGLKESLIEYLIEHKVRSADPCERYWTYLTLGKLGGNAARAALLTGLKDEHALGRQGASESLASINKVNTES